MRHEKAYQLGKVEEGCNQSRWHRRWLVGLSVHRWGMGWIEILWLPLAKIEHSAGCTYSLDEDSK
jgi:hypothetical protein